MPVARGSGPPRPPVVIRLADPYFIVKYKPPSMMPADREDAGRASEGNADDSTTDDEGPEAVTTSEQEGEAPDTPLSVEQRWLLIAAYRLNAFTSDRRKTGDQIVKEAKGKFASRANASKALSGFVATRLLDSKTGSGGGYWLTPKGKARAERLISPK
jgi:hypothetical protein